MAARLPSEEEAAFALLSEEKKGRPGGRRYDFLRYRSRPHTTPSARVTPAALQGWLRT